MFDFKVVQDGIGGTAAAIDDGDFRIGVGFSVFDNGTLYLCSVSAIVGTSQTDRKVILRHEATVMVAGRKPKTTVSTKPDGVTTLFESREEA